MSRHRLSLVDGLLLLAGAAVLVVMFGVSAKPTRPALTVWSCGSNYESLCDFAERFEDKYDCRVRYAAAPVQFLLERALEADDPPDVIVGRAGPGWQALKQAGMLARGPEFFAMDPYVIITPRGNSADIRSLEDLGRDGVRVAASPLAMRPRGKCPSHLMAAVSDQFFPGLCERWENNCVVRAQCGRKLAGPVVAGEVDAAIVPHCMTAWPSVQGKIEVVPIKAEHLLAMKQCRATIPQCAGLLTTTKRRDLADAFITEMTQGIGHSVFPAHGYLPIDSPEAQALKDLMEVFRPQDMPGWQLHMAKGLHEDGALGAALRRFLVIIHTFGPTRYDAQARFWAGKCLQAMGRDEAARSQWRRLVHEFPRRGKVEYDSEVLHVGRPVPGVERLTDDHWVAAAREALAEPPGPPTLSAEHRRFLAAFTLTHEPVTEGDPDKNGTRSLQIGKDLLEAGRYVAATRDLLKVPTLNYPSRHMREARFWAGVAAHLRGLPHVAAAQWDELTGEHDRWAPAAAQALKMAASKAPTSRPISLVPMPPWQPAYDTHAERGMSYAMELWEHELPLYTFKEMTKILAGVYGKPGDLAPTARYWMGVSCLALDRPQAAHSQWTLLQRCYPDSERWVNMARGAQERLEPEHRTDLPFVGKFTRPQDIGELKQPPRSSFGKRFRGAEEMFNAGLLDDDQPLLEYWKVMTVTDPSQEKNKEIRPRAEFKAGLCCRKAGREDAARRHFRNVVERYPDHPAAKQAAQALAEGGN